MAYSPTMMRWMTQDPDGYIDGANRYGFVNDSPNKYLDPSGNAKISVNGDPWTFITADLNHTHTIPENLRPNGRIDAGPHWHGPDGTKYFPEVGLTQDKDGNWSPACRKFRDDFSDAARSNMKNSANLRRAGILGLLAVVSLAYNEASGENAANANEMKDFLHKLQNTDPTDPDYDNLVAQIANDMEKLTGQKVSSDVVLNMLLK